MSYERFHKYGFNYFPPDQAQYELARKLRSASRPAIRTLAYITSQQLVEAMSSTDNPERQAVGTTISDGLDVVSTFHVGRHFGATFANVDVGLFRDPDQLEGDSRFDPEFSQLCREMSLVGGRILSTIGLSQPAHYSQVQKSASGIGSVPTANLGLIQFTDKCAPNRVRHRTPEAFINIGNEEQVWSIGGASPRQRIGITQEVGGIIVRESRPSLTAYPSPHWEIAADTGEQLVIRTGIVREFDRRFPPPRRPMNL